MDNSSLENSPVGQLVPISDTDARFGAFTAHAFLPNPLPADSEVNFSNEAWAAIAEAREMIGRLDQECGHLPNPSLLIRPALLREAMDTSALEGTTGVLTELLEAQLPDAGPFSPETLEIRAYESAANNAFDAVRNRPISTGLLCEIQAEIFQHAKDPPLNLGAVRNHQVWIGPKNRPISEARFVPPPGDDRLKAGLEQMLTWIETDSHLPSVVRAALAHYQFETLHPFSDGNGRIGRLLAILHLLRSGEIREPAITMSPWLLPRREQYQDELLRVSQSGNWSPWVTFFCNGISSQCQSLLDGARRITDWVARSKSLIKSRGWSRTILDLIDELAEWPVLTKTSAAGARGVTYQAASTAVERLVSLGILREMTGRTYNRIYRADAVISIVESI